MEDRCVCCGDVIPEGRQVCPNCEHKYDANKFFDRPKTNYDRIKAMDALELAAFLYDISRHRFDYPQSKEVWKRWVMQETQDG